MAWTSERIYQGVRNATHQRQKTGEPLPEMVFATVSDKAPGATSNGPDRWARAAKYFWFGALVALLIVMAFAFDAPIGRWVSRNPDPAWRRTASLITQYANLPFLLLAAVGLLAAGFWRRNRFWKRLALALILSSCLSGLVATAIRCTTGRTRPSAKEPQGWYGIRHNSQWIIGKYDYSSFPSGHTGTAMGFAGVFLLGVRRWKLPAVLLGVLMGWSRVFLGCHHLSDVVVSALIGMAVGYLTWHRILPALEQMWLPTPLQPTG
jgi:undecaprenyl-diphosphatase